MEEATIQEPKKRLTSTDRIYDAVRELRELDQIATRETVAELTGLKLQIVDDRLRALVDDGKLKRLMRGVYELVEQYPPTRPIWCGLLDGGMTKIEIGEVVLDLNPQEARKLARLLSSLHDDARVLESARQQMIAAERLASRAQNLEGLVRAVLAARYPALLEDEVAVAIPPYPRPGE